MFASRDSMDILNDMSYHLGVSQNLVAPKLTLKNDEN